MQRIRNFIFKIKRVSNKFYLRHSSDSRPSSYPYMSGDSFRRISDHFYDELEKLDPDNVKEKDIVFVNADMLDEYFFKIHQKIKNKYVLITHNSDKNIDEEKKNVYLDDRIIAWYGQNIVVRHPRIIPLPIGIENLHHYNNGVVKIFDVLRHAPASEKKNRILFGFNIMSNQSERQPAFDVLSKNKLADRIEQWPNSKDYLRKLSGYTFVASPPGNGLDCHRTWEALYLGVVPIVKRSVAVEYFKSLDLPLMVVDDWQELESYGEADLARKYEDMRPLFKNQALWVDYWTKKIKN